MKDIPEDVFANVIVEYLPYSTLKELAKINIAVRRTHLRCLAEDSSSFYFATRDQDYELLNLIKDKPHRGSACEFCNGAEVGPKFAYVALKRFNEKSFSDVLMEVQITSILASVCLRILESLTCFFLMLID